MATTDQQLKRIQDKVQLLAKQLAILHKENSKLKEEWESAQQKLSVQQNHIDKLQQQLKVLKFNTGKMNEADKKDFEKTIDLYRKEIEQCIALLSE